MAKREVKITQDTNLSLYDGFKMFINSKRANNISSDTIDFYEDCLHRFELFLQDEYDIESVNDIMLKQINNEMIDEYKIHLNNSKIASTSINTYLNGIRPVIYFLIDKEYVEPFKIPKVKAVKPKKQTYTDKELKTLLVKPNIKKCPFIEYRDWVIINMLIGTGLRINTLVNIKIEDIDFDNNIMYCKTTKNKIEQVMPLSKTLSSVLKEYVQIRLSQADITPADWLLCSRYGEKLTRNALQHSLNKYNHRRGVETTGQHLYRHTFAKMWLLSGGDVSRLQSILGHQDMEMIKEYVDIFLSDLQKDFDNFNPLENFKTRKALKINS